MTPDELSRTVLRAVRCAVDDGELSVTVPERVVVTEPGPGGCGDFATNVALQLARPAGQPPLRVAEILRPRLIGADGIRDVVVTGPGFLNITLDAQADPVTALVREILARGAAYGHGDALAGQVVALRVPYEVRAEVIADAVVRIVATQGGRATVEHGEPVNLRPVPAPEDPAPLGPDASQWALLHPAPHDRPRITADHLVQRESNPLFRVRYAHARIRALGRNAARLGFTAEPGPLDARPLDTGPVGTGPIGTDPLGPDPLGPDLLHARPLGSGALNAGPLGPVPGKSGSLATDPAGTGAPNGHPVETGAPHTSPLDAGRTGIGAPHTSSFDAGPATQSPSATRPTDRVTDTGAAAPHRTSAPDVAAPHRTPDPDVAAPHRIPDTGVATPHRTPDTSAATHYRATATGPTPHPAADRPHRIPDTSAATPHPAADRPHPATPHPHPAADHPHPATDRPHPATPHPPTDLLTPLADHPRILAAAATHRAPDRLARHLVTVADAVLPFLPFVLPRGEEKPSAAHRARLALAEAAGTVLAGGLFLLGIDAPEHL